MTRTLWLPPGTVTTIPQPGRRGPRGPLTPWTASMRWCADHPKEVVLLCLTDRPEGIVHRIRTAKFTAVQQGEWWTTQRATVDGMSAVYLQCVEPGEPDA